MNEPTVNEPNIRPDRIHVLPDLTPGPHRTDSDDIWWWLPVIGPTSTSLAYLLARNIRIEEDLVDQLFNSSEKRLARILLLLSRYGKESKPEPIVSKVNQETLAAMIGTTRARVSYFMNKFRRLGFIEYNGGLHVHSSLLNVVLHD